MNPAFRGGLERRRSAMAVVELLVCGAIILTLGGMLLPTVGAARERARETLCTANLRQLGQAMSAYAATYEGMYPPNANSPSPGQYWYDQPRVGGYVGNYLTRLGKPGGSIYACPSDDGGARSYSVNFWASSLVDPVPLGTPPRGRLWGCTAPNADRLIVVAESWSYLGSQATGWLAPATVGYGGETAGERFGAQGGLAPPMPAGRWGMINCEIPFGRHGGKANIAFADGHVAAMTQQDLVDLSSGTITGQAFWSPVDAASGAH